MNVFELLGMVVIAWAMTVHAGARPEYPGQSILIRRDNMSAVHWVRQEQHLGQGALDLTSAVLASSSLEGPLRNRLNAITRQVSWSVFCRLMSSDKFCLRRDTSPEEVSWALIDFAAWCFESKGNLASTISGKFAAVQ